MENTTTKILYTVKEVAEILHTNPAYLYSLIKAGHLPALRLGAYKIRHETLMKFLSDHEGDNLRDPKNVHPIRKAGSEEHDEHKPGDIYINSEGHIIAIPFR